MFVEKIKNTFELRKKKRAQHNFTTILIEFY